MSQFGQGFSEKVRARVTEHLAKRLIGKNELPVYVPPCHAGSSLLDGCAHACLRLAECFLIALMLNRLRDLPGDCGCKSELVLGEGVWRIKINHEFADQLSITNQRDEGSCVNPFGANHRFQ